MQTNQPLPPRDSPSLGRLARRVSAWTTNGLVTVMLVVVALGFGREVLHWWHDEGTSPMAAPSVPADRLGDAAAPHVLAFGDQTWSIRRQEFSGPAGDLPAALLSACRAAILDSRPRGESPDAAEQELLMRLAGQQPMAEQHGQWRIYRWGAGHSVLIGTRALAGAGRAKAHPTIGGTSLDETPYRVVLWGVAVPAADAWTLCLFQSGGGTGGAGQGSDEIPPPPGGHRLVSIRAAAGGAITAFSADDGQAARNFYDLWFAERGWRAAARWQQIASGWHARFETRSRVPPLAADIRLGTDPQGRWTGLVMESGQ